MKTLHQPAAPGVALFALLLIWPGLACAGDELTLWYQEPAHRAMNEALPIGNGRIGGVLFGGVERERFQFNDISLWTGDDHAYGAYQTFGDLLISLDARPRPLITCPTGQKSSPAEDVEFSFDDDRSTKWCVEHNSKPVVWQAQMPEGAPPLASYSLTSGNDKPERDPRSWEFAGSADGRQWDELDRHEDQPPFSKRLQEMVFPLKDSKPYRFYRITFSKNQGASQLQLAEVGLNARKLGDEKTAKDYRRELGLATGAARTEFTRDGVHHRREIFASHPAEVIALRWSADRPGAITGSVRLRGAHRDKTVAEGGTLAFSGKLGNGLQYEALARVITRGGTMELADDQMLLKNCDEAVILLAAGTDYVFDYARHNRSGVNPHERLLAQLDAAARLPYDSLKAEQTRDFQAIFNRVAVDFGKSSPEQRALADRQAKGGSGQHGRPGIGSPLLPVRPLSADL